MTKDEAEELKRIIDSGYHNRDDYPPFKVESWNDRTVYGEYIFKIIDEFIKEE